MRWADCTGTQNTSAISTWRLPKPASRLFMPRSSHGQPDGGDDAARRVALDLERCAHAIQGREPRPDIGKPDAGSGLCAKAAAAVRDREDQRARCAFGADADRAAFGE